MKFYSTFKFKKVICTTMLVLLGGICMPVNNLHAETVINFQVSLEDNTKASGGFPRTPIRPVQATLDNNTLYVIGLHAEFLLVIIGKSEDENEVVYQTIVPADVNGVELPTTLSGEYEIQLHTGGTYYFFSKIEI